MLVSVGGRLHRVKERRWDSARSPARRSRNLWTLTTETTYEQTFAHFSRSERAARKLERWRTLPGKEPVAQFAERMASRAIYALSPETLSVPAIGLTTPSHGGMAALCAAA